MLDKEQLKKLVMQHFSLVDPNEVKETPEALVEETFGEIADENKAFIFVYPGSTLEVGSEVSILTEDGQKAPAPEGYHRLADGKTIKVEGGKVTEIESSESKEEMYETTEDVEVEEGEKKGEQFGADPSISKVEGTKPDNATTKINADQEPIDAMTKVNMAMEEMGAKVAELEGKVKEMMAKMEDMKGKFSAIAVEPASERTLPFKKEEAKDEFQSNNADLMRMMSEKLKRKK